MTQRLVCVLPSKNEVETIKQVLSKLVETLQNVSDIELIKIILTDDSDDETRAIASTFEKVEVIDGGGALGRAMIRGLWKARSYDPDIVVSLDSDGQLDMSEVKTFLNHYLNEKVDLLLGSRFMNGDHIEYQYPFINKVGVILLSTFLSMATKQRITDSHGGLRVMSRKFIDQVKVAGNHTYVQETIIGAARNGLIIKEIQSVWLIRKSGGSRVVANIPRYIRRTLPFILFRAAYDLKFFLPIGSVFLIYGKYLSSLTLMLLGGLSLLVSIFCRALGIMGDRKDVISAKSR